MQSIQLCVFVHKPVPAFSAQRLSVLFLTTTAFGDGDRTECFHVTSSSFLMQNQLRLSQLYYSTSIPNFDLVVDAISDNAAPV